MSTPNIPSGSANSPRVATLPRMTSFDFKEAVYRNMSFLDLLSAAVKTLNNVIGTDALGTWGPAFQVREADMILKNIGHTRLLESGLNIVPVSESFNLFWLIFYKNGQRVVVSTDPQRSTDYYSEFKIVRVLLNIDSMSIARRLELSYQRRRLKKHQEIAGKISASEKN